MPGLGRGTITFTSFHFVFQVYGSFAELPSIYRGVGQKVHQSASYRSVHLVGRWVRPRLGWVRTRWSQEGTGEPTPSPLSKSLLEFRSPVLIHQPRISAKRSQDTVDQRGPHPLTAHRRPAITSNRPTHHPCTSHVGSNPRRGTSRYPHSSRTPICSSCTAWGRSPTARSGTSSRNRLRGVRPGRTGVWRFRSRLGLMMRDWWS